MSRFSELKKFSGYKPVATEPLDEKEIASIKSIEIVERENKEDGGKFLVMCFYLKSGETSSEYLSNRSDLEKGMKVDPESVEFITLENAAGEEIYRVDGEELIPPTPKKKGKTKLVLPLSSPKDS